MKSTKCFKPQRPPSHISNTVYSLNKAADICRTSPDELLALAAENQLEVSIYLPDSTSVFFFPRMRAIPGTENGEAGINNAPPTSFPPIPIPNAVMLNLSPADCSKILTLKRHIQSNFPSIYQSELKENAEIILGDEPGMRSMQIHYDLQLKHIGQDNISPGVFGKLSQLQESGNIVLMEGPAYFVTYPDRFQGQCKQISFGIDDLFITDHQLINMFLHYKLPIDTISCPDTASFPPLLKALIVIAFKSNIEKIYGNKSFPVEEEIVNELMKKYRFPSRGFAKKSYALIKPTKRDIKFNCGFLTKKLMGLIQAYQDNFGRNHSNSVATRPSRSTIELALEHTYNIPNSLCACARKIITPSSKK